MIAQHTLAMISEQGAGGGERLIYEDHLS
jgi:hypothetical protein